MKRLFLISAVFVLALNSSFVSADVVDFTETFAFDPLAFNSNWRGPDAAGNDLLTRVESGGPDGSAFVSFESSFADFPDGSGMGGGQPTPVLFRGQQNFDSSGGAFVGDWIEDGVTELSFEFRHNLPVPVTVFSRFASNANFPGALAIDFAPVLPFQWTEVSIAIDPTSPQFISFENSDFESIFSDIANIQIGVSVPEGFGGSPVPFTFDLDNVQVTTAAVPEPATGLFLGTLTMMTIARRRRS